MKPIAFAETLSCDVLVVGAGAAGIRAALSAAARGRDTVLLSPVIAGEGGSTFYPLSPPWGVLYATDAQDVQTFCDEILAASGGCADEALARTLAEESVRARDTLLGEGLPLHTHASLGLTGCFGARPRGAVLPRLDAARDSWRRELLAAANLRQLTGWEATTLLTQSGRAVGVTALDARGRLLLARAGAVVLATGGSIGLYERSYAYGNLVGAGVAMAARQGAACVNLEFIQFIHGTLAPVYGLNYYQFTFGEGPRVLNARGEPFLSRYLPPGVSEAECLTLRGGHGPFSVEDAGRFFDLAVVAEGRRGFGEGATLVPDPARLSGPRYAHWRDFLAQQGYTTATPMTIAPFAQAQNGGIRLRAGARTDLEGLFACGECAGGCHGANRMGGNAILATQVFGRLAGENAADACAAAPLRARLPETEAARRWADEMADTAPNATSAEALREVRRLMQTHAFLERSEAGLSQAEAALSALRVDARSALGTPEAAAAARARNAIDTARLMVCAMRRRRESRGGHNRTDFPAHDPALAAPLPTAWRDLTPTADRG